MFHQLLWSISAKIGKPYDWIFFHLPAEDLFYFEHCYFIEAGVKVKPASEAVVKNPFIF